jgi:hypothetical protein
VLRIRDVNPGSWIPDFGSRIPDPKTATKERGEKKLVVVPFFCNNKFHIIEKYFIFEMLKTKIWANFQRIILKELFTPKLSLSSQNYGFGIRVPDPGVKKAPDPGSGSATLVL